MMNLGFSRRTDLALTALHALSRAHGEKRPRAQLARETGTTTSYLPQVMGPLIKAGWVASERGPGGGYRLTEAASHARLLELIEMYEGPTRDGRCVLRDGHCPERVCQVHAVWAQAQRVLVEGFEDVPVLSGQGEKR